MVAKNIKLAFTALYILFLYSCSEVLSEKDFRKDCLVIEQVLNSILVNTEKLAYGFNHDYYYEQINSGKEFSKENEIKEFVQRHSLKGLYYSNESHLILYTTNLKGFVRLNADITDNIGFDNCYCSMQHLLDRNDNGITPFARHIKNNWFYVELAETVD